MIPKTTKENSKQGGFSFDMVCKQQIGAGPMVKAHYQFLDLRQGVCYHIHGSQQNKA